MEHELLGFLTEPGPFHPPVPSKDRIPLLSDGCVFQHLSYMAFTRIAKPSCGPKITLK